MKNDHVTRVVVERDDLDDKIGKLEAFIDSDAIFKIDIQHRNLLAEQLVFMKGYSNTLVKRLDLFNK